MVLMDSRGPRKYTLSEVTDIFYLWMFEEVDYERRLSAFLEHEVGNESNLPFADDGPHASVFVRLVLFDEASDHLRFIR